MTDQERDRLRERIRTDLLASNGDGFICQECGLGQEDMDDRVIRLIESETRKARAELGEEIKSEFDPTRTTVPIMHDELGVQEALETRYSVYPAENIFSKVDAAVIRLSRKEAGE